VSGPDCARMVNVGLIGIGAIGRMHFDCWRKSPYGRVTAFASRDPRKRAGDWAGGEFNLGDQAAEKIDLTGITAYENAADLFADAAVQIVDICTSTPHHARLAIAALRAGKDVICEKPMALSVEECRAVEEAVASSGRQLMVAHCLRYWPHYVKAKELLAGGEYGRAVYAQFQRTAGAPAWSSDGWLMKPEESGGVLDMQIHDIDVALWWFGIPQSIEARGWFRGGVPMILDATWNYAGGPLVELHGAWDPNGGAFRHAFRLVMEKASLVYDLATAPSVLQLHREGTTSELPMEETSAHQAELDDFARCIAEGRPFTRFTPAESRLSVEVGLEELRQCQGRAG
jgi:1,5-anhydro-D-fructose reductase (1,5-anhydro-D-mannitol-forming)